MRHLLFAPMLALALGSSVHAEPPQEERPEADRPTDFEIVKEAEQPEGWPEPGPVFAVTVKKYPAYRAAYAEGNAAFWLLFAHITSKEIPMTAPVEMAMQEAPRGYAMVNMGFLYQSTDVGETGEEGKVQVIDVPAMTVLSYGTNGPVTRETYEAGLEQIEAELAKLEDWQSTGKLRLLGFNSPMIPEAFRFYEIQVILEPKKEPAEDQPEPGDQQPEGQEQ